MTEVRTLLITDVVDSTRLTEVLGDGRMAELWRRHDAIARETLPRHGGLEIDRTDGFLLLFDNPADALAYATAYHGSLQVLSGELGVELRARAGVHVGEVSLRRNPAEHVARGAKPLEVDGLAKPIAARILSVAAPGQTLLSSAARAGLDGDFVSHGHWRLKGVEEPVELWERRQAGAPLTPPPDAEKAVRVVWSGDLWLPAREVRHTLPSERDPFVGREDDLRSLTHRFEQGHRLVSVLGIGGCGKTRLATRFGWTRLGDFPGGVWFCDVSDARTLDDLIAATARGLDVALGGGDPIVQLGRVLAGRGRCLVVLDNFEQVAQHAESCLGRWLDTTSEARFLVTSRDVLGLRGEETFALPLLDEPDAVRLFTKRAAAAGWPAQTSKEDLEGVRELVRMLEGLPLAIELAAARVRTMTPRAIAARMAERFRLLSSTGRRGRHATLRATLDWSWNLLTEPQRAALAQLTVFEGGAPLTGVDQVIDVRDLDPDLWTEDLLQSLIDKSLCRSNGERVDLLTTVHEYAAEHLRTAGSFPGSGPEAAAAAEARHGAWAARLDEGSWLHERANVIAACRRAAARGDGSTAVSTLWAAWQALRRLGPYATALDLVSAVRRLEPLPEALSARVDEVEGKALTLVGRPDQALARFEAARRAALALGDARSEARLSFECAAVHVTKGRWSEARALFDASLAGAAALGDRVIEAMACAGLGHVYAGQGDPLQALAVQERAVAAARAGGDRYIEGIALMNVGSMQAILGRPDAARASFTAALELLQAVGARQQAAQLLGNLGAFEARAGSLDDALRYYREAAGILRDIGARPQEATLVGNIGAVHRDRLEFDEAVAHYERALALHQECGNTEFEGAALASLGEVYTRVGRLDDAERALQAGLDALEKGRWSRQSGIARSHFAALHLARGRHAEALEASQDSVNLLRGVRDPYALATALTIQARVAGRAGALDDARAALAEAEDLGRRLGISQALKTRLDEARAELEP